MVYKKICTGVEFTKFICSRKFLITVLGKMLGRSTENAKLIIVPEMKSNFFGTRTQTTNYEQYRLHFTETEHNMRNFAGEVPYG